MARKTASIGTLLVPAAAPAGPIEVWVTDGPGCHDCPHGKRVNRACIACWHPDVPGWPGMLVSYAHHCHRHPVQPAPQADQGAPS